jgi:hypothetical protein
MPAVRQVLFTDVQITIRQTVVLLPVLGYWSELCSYWITQNGPASDWLLIKRHCISKEGLPRVQVQN